MAWKLGTTTPGQKTCAPSQTAELDGGLTRDGFRSDYAWQVGRFIDAGYAVVAPDLEGLDPDATPCLYYDLDSLARSLVAGVVAARDAEPSLSNRWAAVGHSDGGHGILGVPAHAARFGADAKAAETPDAAEHMEITRHFQGALMATGLGVVEPSSDPASDHGA